MHPTLAAGNKRPHPEDPVLAEAVVLATVRRHVPTAHTVTGVDESGGEARTYAIDGNLILKTQRPHRLRPRTSLEKEARFLTHLAASAPDDPLPVPRVFGRGRNETLDYIVMSRVPGVAARHAALSGPARTELLLTLGQVLARVHDVPQGPLASSGLFPGDRSAADLRARLETSFAGTVHALGEAGVTWLGRCSPEQVMAVALGAVPDATPAFVALHTNPGPEHTFVDPETRRFTGLIDFGDAHFGHPAMDLVRWPDTFDRATMLDGYQQARTVVDDAFTITWRIFALLADLQAVSRRPEQAAHRAAQIERTLESF